ncbi:hypothetical protein GCM10018954_005630 [Kutzneria kofuensis]
MLRHYYTAREGLRAIPETGRAASAALTLFGGAGRRPAASSIATYRVTQQVDSATYVLLLLRRIRMTI